MRVIQPRVDILTMREPREIMANIEIAGRTCYKSEDRIADNSAEKFIRSLISRGHEAVLEHESITVRFTCDRGVSHEIVRHRLASYCQESTRYCNYAAEGFGSEITVIEPCYLIPGTSAWCIWMEAMEKCENNYFNLLDEGCTPQEARAVLPNSLKTELVMTANIREWRNFLKLRTSRAAHPQMREVATMLLNELKSRIPVLFEDIAV